MRAHSVLWRLVSTRPAQAPLAAPSRRRDQGASSSLSSSSSSSLRLTSAQVLVALALDNPDVPFAPQIPDLVLILLRHMSDADAFVAVQRLLRKSVAAGWASYLVTP